MMCCFPSNYRDVMQDKDVNQNRKGLNKHEVCDYTAMTAG